MTKQPARPAAKPQSTTTRHYGPCPACSGSGKLRNLVRMRNVKQMRTQTPAAERNRVCDICQGKGQVITRETTKN
jgi:DnaJ-class molecular chaperone